MTTKEWVAKAKEHSDKLIELIAAWHPGVTHFPPGQTDEEFEQAVGRITRQPDLPITAPNAEAACRSIRKELAAKPSDPVEEFKLALEAGNVGKIYSLLSGAWFGVPESRNCWQITGFTEAVDLMDDMPEPEELKHED